MWSWYWINRSLLSTLPLIYHQLTLSSKKKTMKLRANCWLILTVTFYLEIMFKTFFLEMSQQRMLLILNATLNYFFVYFLCYIILYYISIRRLHFFEQRVVKLYYTKTWRKIDRAFSQLFWYISYICAYDSYKLWNSC